MKKLILILAASIAFSSCKKQEEKNAGTQNVSMEISDQGFKDLFKSVKGVELDSSGIVKYNVGAKGQNEKIQRLATDRIPGCAGLPTAISGLNSGSGYEFYKFTKDRSAEASFMGFGGSIGKKEMLLIQDYVRYQNVVCNGVNKRVGIGLRCYIHVKGIKASFKGSYADIAANAQLNDMTANFSLKSLGFAMDGDLIADGLIGESDYNVDNFGKLAVTFTNVLKTLKNSNSSLVIDPVELPSYSPN